MDKSVRNDLWKGKMIFSEESRQHGVDRTETNFGHYSVSSLLETRTTGIEHVSMRRLASTQSKYDGLNENSICSHNPWQQDHQKVMDAKRGVLKRCKYTSILDRWPKDEVCRASQLVHGWTEEWVKYLDYISKIDISHDAPYRQRLR